MDDEGAKLFDFIAILGFSEESKDPIVLTRMPSEDPPDGPTFPEHVAMFCYPLEEDHKSSPYYKEPTSFSFTLTEIDGTKRYCTCLKYWLPTISEEIQSRKYLAQLSPTLSMTRPLSPRRQPPHSAEDSSRSSSQKEWRTSKYKDETLFWGKLKEEEEEGASTTINEAKKTGGGEDEQTNQETKKENQKTPESDPHKKEKKRKKTDEKMRERRASSEMSSSTSSSSSSSSLKKVPLLKVSEVGSRIDPLEDSKKSFLFEDLITPPHLAQTLQELGNFHREASQNVDTFLSRRGNRKREEGAFFTSRCLLMISRNRLFETHRNLLLLAFIHAADRDMRSRFNFPVENEVRRETLDDLLPDLLSISIPPPNISKKISIGSNSFIFNLEKNGGLPLMETPIDMVFENLGIRNTLSVFCALLKESKILLLSSHLSLLTLFGEALLSLLYPFEWHHAYIPVLPSSMLEYINAPCPFLIGIHVSLFESLPALCDILVVDLDEGVNRFFSEDHSVDQTAAQPDFSQMIPNSIKNKLIQHLKIIISPNRGHFDSAFKSPFNSSFVSQPSREKWMAAVDPGVDQQIARETDWIPLVPKPDAIRLCFLEMFAELFATYQTCILTVKQYPQPVCVFDTETFLSFNQDQKEFTEFMLDTQGFSVFVDQQHQDSFSPFRNAIACHFSNLSINSLLKKEKEIPFNIWNTKFGQKVLVCWGSETEIDLQKKIRTKSPRAGSNPSTPVDERKLGSAIHETGKGGGGNMMQIRRGTTIDGCALAKKNILMKTSLNRSFGVLEQYNWFEREEGNEKQTNPEENDLSRYLQHHLLSKGYGFEDQPATTIFFTEEMIPPHFRKRDPNSYEFLKSFVHRLLETERSFKGIQSEVVLVQGMLKVPLKRWLFVDALCCEFLIRCRDERVGGVGDDGGGDKVQGKEEDVPSYSKMVKNIDEMGMLMKDEEEKRKKGEVGGRARRGDKNGGALPLPRPPLAASSSILTLSTPTTSTASSASTISPSNSPTSPTLSPFNSTHNTPPSPPTSPLPPPLPPLPPPPSTSPPKSSSPPSSETPTKKQNHSPNSDRASIQKRMATMHNFSSFGDMPLKQSTSASPKKKRKMKGSKTGSLEGGERALSPAPPGTPTSPVKIRRKSSTLQFSNSLTNVFHFKMNQESPKMDLHSSFQTSPTPTPAPAPASPSPPSSSSSSSFPSAYSRSPSPSSYSSFSGDTPSAKLRSTQHPPLSSSTLLFVEQPQRATSPISEFPDLGELTSTGLFPSIFLSKSSFEFLVELSKKMVHYAKKDNDYRSPFLLLTLSSSLALNRGRLRKIAAEQTLASRISSLSLWKDTRFWEIAFYDLVIFEREKQKSLDGEVTKSQMVEQEMDLIVSVLEKLARQMSVIQLSSSVIRNFVFRMSDLVELPYDRCMSLLEPYGQDVDDCDVDLDPNSDREERRSGPEPERREKTHRVGKILSDGRYQKEALELTTLEEPREGESIAPRCCTTIVAHTAVCGTASGQVKMCSLINPFTKTVFSGSHSSAVTHVKRHEGWLTTCSTDKTVKLWDINTGGEACPLEGHQGSVSSSDVSLPDRIVISSSADQLVKLWDMRTATCFASLIGHTGPVSFARLDGTNVISGSEDGSVRIWDIRKIQAIHALFGHTGPVLHLEVDSTSVFSSSVDGTVRIWSKDIGGCKKVLVGHSGPINCFKTIPQQNLLVTGSSDRTVRVWKYLTGDQPRVLRSHRGSVRSLEVFDNEIVWSGGEYGEMKIWDSRKRRCLRTLQGHSGAVACIHSNPNVYYPQLLSASESGGIRMWQFHKMLDISRKKGVKRVKNK